MIYAFTGLKQSGKNTAARIWQHLDAYYNCKEIRHIVEAAEKQKNGDTSIATDISKYADPITYVTSRIGDDVAYSEWIERQFSEKLKQIICIITGCHPNDLAREEFRNTSSGFHKSPVCGGTYTYRELMDHVGTNLFRKELAANIWVNALLQEYKSHAYTQRPNWLITDMRMRNEAEAVKFLNGKIIRLVNTSEFTNLSNLPDTEYEVILIDADYTIENNKELPLENLIRQVGDIMSAENII